MVFVMFGVVFGIGSIGIRDVPERARGSDKI